MAKDTAPKDLGKQGKEKDVTELEGKFPNLYKGEDAKGVKLAVGDVVLFRARVTRILAEKDEATANANFEIVAEHCAELSRPTFTCNTLLCEKAN